MQKLSSNLNDQVCIRILERFVLAAFADMDDALGAMYAVRVIAYKELHDQT